jgi:hypothetical protein
MAVQSGVIQSWLKLSVPGLTQMIFDRVAFWILAEDRFLRETQKKDV